MPRYSRSGEYALRYGVVAALMLVLMAKTCLGRWPEAPSGGLVGFSLIVVVAPLFGVWRYLREWRLARVRIAHSGIDLTDWLGRETHIAWEGVQAVWEAVDATSRNRDRHLSVELVSDDGRPRIVNIARHDWQSGELEFARDELVRVLSFTEVEAPKTFWTVTKKRVWRRV